MLLFGLAAMLKALVYLRFVIYIPANCRFYSLNDILHILQRSGYSLRFYRCISGFRPVSSNIFLSPLNLGKGSGVVACCLWLTAEV